MHRQQPLAHLLHAQRTPAFDIFGRRGEEGSERPEDANGELQARPQQQTPATAANDVNDAS